jgi:hypothetical protein
LAPLGVCPPRWAGPIRMEAGNQMDRSMIQDHLAIAERHVVLGAKHIATQKSIVAELEADGHDASQALHLLETFEEMQDMHVADRDRLRAELDRVKKTAAPKPASARLLS